MKKESSKGRNRLIFGQKVRKSYAWFPRSYRKAVTALELLFPISSSDKVYGKIVFSQVNACFPSVNQRNSFIKIGVGVQRGRTIEQFFCFCWKTLRFFLFTDSAKRILSFSFLRRKKIGQAFLVQLNFYSHTSKECRKNVLPTLSRVR